MNATIRRYFAIRRARPGWIPAYAWMMACMGVKP